MYSSNKSDIWIVPDYVSQATFTVVGGNGENGYSISPLDGSKTILTGGLASNVLVTISVTSGDTYNIYVGNNGDSNNGQSTTPLNIGSGGRGNKDQNYYAGNGGSISAIYLNNTPVIVAAGGGGSGGGSVTYGKNAILTTTINSGISGITNGGSNISYGGGGGGYPGGIPASVGVNGGNAGTSLIPETAIGASSSLASSTGTPYISIGFSYNPTTTSPPTTTQFQPTTTQFQPTTTQFQPTTTQFQPTTTQFQPTTRQIPNTDNTDNTITTIPLTTYGYKITKNNIYDNPNVNLYQYNFTGTSKIYDPLLYRTSEKFAPLNLYDDKYAKY
jgi:hypothetical protein